MNDSKPAAYYDALARQRAQLIMQVRSGLLSVKEAARQLHICRRTYYKWERRALPAMVEALRNRSQGRQRLQNEALQSLLVKNRELRIRERERFVFMLRIALGYVTLESLKQDLRNKLPSKDLATLYTYMTARSHCKRIRALIVIFDLYGIPAGSIVRGLGPTEILYQSE